MGRLAASLRTGLLCAVFSLAVANLPICTYTYDPDKSPKFPNGTQMCCGECRYMIGEQRCLQSEVVAVLVLSSMWFGALLAFFFDRLFGSPLPGSVGDNCRRCCYAYLPCAAGPCCSEEPLLDVCDVESGSGRDGKDVAGGGSAADGTEDLECFFEEEYDEDGGRRWRESAIDGGSHDGIHETCRGNITVHSF